MQTFSNENELNLHENERTCETYFHVDGLAGRLVLTQRQESTREWPISVMRTENASKDSRL